MQNQQNSQLSPSDNRNLIIFMLVTAMLYFAYDHFVMKPHETALREARMETIKQRIENGETIPPSINSHLTSPVQLPSANEILKTEKHLTINSDTLTGAISLKGGLINALSLNDYYQTLNGNDNVEILSPKGTESQKTIEYGWVSTDISLALPNNETLWSVKDNKNLTPNTPVTLSWNNGQGITFERTFTLDDQYALTVTQLVINQSSKNITLYPYGLIAQKGLPSGLQKNMISHEGLLAHVGGNFEKSAYKKIRKSQSKQFNEQTGWIGITDKYWLTALIPAQNQQTKFRFNYSGTPPKKNQKDTGLYQADFTGSAIILAQGQSNAVTSHVFAGPKKVIMLKKYSKELGVDRLDLSVDFGMFWFLTIPFFYCLHYLGDLIGNMGFAIIALTIIIRTIASPLTYASYKSFAKMKKVMPQVTELKEKYGEENKEKLQQEMLKLYQSEGVNPAAGCFPLILQIPIFFAFYKILFITLELRHAPFIGWIHDLSAADPTNLFTLFGLINWNPPSIMHIGIWPCLMLIAMMLQQKLNPPPIDKMQRDMMRMFPIIMCFVMAKFASGLVVYWTISAFFGIIQQIIIMRKMGVPVHLLGESHKTAPVVVEEETPVIEKPKKAKAIKNIKPPKPKKKKKK